MRGHQLKIPARFAGSMLTDPFECSEASREGFAVHPPERSGRRAVGDPKWSATDSWPTSGASLVDCAHAGTARGAGPGSARGVADGPIFGLVGP